MKYDLSDMTKTDKFFMMSVHGYGLCLYQTTVTSYEHGIECLNLFTGDTEFHHYLNGDEQTQVYLIDNTKDANELVRMYKEG